MKREPHRDGGDRMVAPKKKRNRKGRASEARRLVQRIEAASAAIRSPETASRDLATERLCVLHATKRVLRRDVYERAPELEGRPVFRGTPGGRS